MGAAIVRPTFLGDRGVVQRVGDECLHEVPEDTTSITPGRVVEGVDYHGETLLIRLCESWWTHAPRDTW